MKLDLSLERLLRPVKKRMLLALKIGDSFDQLPNGFDRDLYLELNPDVREARLDPAKHYLKHGRYEERVFSLPNAKLGVDQKVVESSSIFRGMLPAGFARDLYIKLNPDVHEAGIDPEEHYLRHGRHEGRSFSLPKIEIFSEGDIRGDRPTILVVSHEASRTGAPILSLNIVQAFSRHYNVVVLLLGGGELFDAFSHSGAVAVLTSSDLRGNAVMADLVVEQVCGRFDLKFALVNSIESRLVLPELAKRYVPTISLFHEFAAYTRPRSAFRDALFWSSEAVFSANVTKESALAEFPDLGGESIHILPQGRCQLPFREGTEEQNLAERKRIRRLVRPENTTDKTVVILGAGFFQLRKGIDIFIECASRVLAKAEGVDCRFVWIGKGYDPENDLGYSVYLSDQIRRSGLQDRFSIIDETTAIEVAYEEADIFLLTSRLDPLPNVAIDAMSIGLPVLCFDKTTGIADFLVSNGLRDYCVANYLDSADLSKKILTLARSEHLREEISRRCKDSAHQFFSMPQYVARLESLAQDACEQMLRERLDASMILESGLFRQDFACAPYRMLGSTDAAVRAYVRAWASGIDRRKPFPGFHPGVYREQHGLETEGSDPFADYLRAGQPDGPWISPVIVSGEITESMLPKNQQVALHIHVYYPELLSEITNRLSCNRIVPDLFISISDEQDRGIVAREFGTYPGNVVDIRVVPNRGRDIGPFLTEFGDQLVADYEYIGHLHTKRSADVKEVATGEVWFRFLLENLLGGEAGGMADVILSRMKIDESIGMVFPDDPHVLSWGLANQRFAESLSCSVGLRSLPENFSFPVGTMFWAKASALKPFVNLKLGWDDYPTEPLPYDGTFLHAIERLFPLVLNNNNLRTALTNVVGITR